MLCCVGLVDSVDVVDHTHWRSVGPGCYRDCGRGIVLLLHSRYEASLSFASRDAPTPEYAAIVLREVLGPLLVTEFEIDVADYRAIAVIGLLPLTPNAKLVERLRLLAANDTQVDRRRTRDVAA